MATRVVPARVSLAVKVMWNMRNMFCAKSGGRPRVASAFSTGTFTPLRPKIRITVLSLREHVDATSCGNPQSSATMREPSIVRHHESSEQTLQMLYAIIIRLAQNGAPAFLKVWTATVSPLACTGSWSDCRSHRDRDGGPGAGSTTSMRAPSSGSGKISGWGVATEGPGPQVALNLTGSLRTRLKFGHSGWSTQSRCPPRPGPPSNIQHWQLTRSLRLRATGTT